MAQNNIKKDSQNIQQQQMQLQNSSASSQLLPSLNFDDDNDLQNLAGIGDVCDDLPDVFWDYGDGSNDVNVSSMDYADVNAIPTTAPGAGTIHPQSSTTPMAKNKQPTEKNDLPTSAFPTANSSTSQTHQQQSLRFLPNVNVDLNTLPNYVTASYAQLAGNLGGYPPFLLPSATASLESGGGGGGSFTPNLPNSLLPQPQRGNGNLGQQPPQQQKHQQLQHPQLGGTVNILQHVNNSLPNTTASGTSTSASATINNTQQSDQASAQTLHNQIFGISSQAGLNPQLVYQSIQQQTNDQQQHQVANLQLLQQQIQGNPQHHILPSQLFRTNGISIPSGGGDQGRVSSQELQPQSQGVVSSQQQQPQVQVKCNAQQESTTMSIITKQKPVYHSQAGPILQKSGQQPQKFNKPGSSHAVSQPTPSILKPKTSTISTQLSSCSKPQEESGVGKNIPAATTAPTQVTKMNVVSSSDTDGEHQGSLTRALASVKKNRRSFPHDSSSDINSNQRKTSSPLLSIPSVYSQQDVKHKNTNIHSSDDTSDSSKKNSSIENKHAEEQMTEEERALANRKRNREHARNTRARKKAYLESLKSTLDELCRERDSLVSERAGAASLLLEVQKTRTDVLLSFFALRSSYEKRRSLWSSILDESVNCVMPVTPYRSFPASEVQISKCQRTIMGVDGMIADAASIHVLFHSLVDRSQFPDGKVQFRYTLIAEEAVVSGSQMMARWSMATTNAKKLGAKKEVKKMGMLCARFNSAHKIVHLEVMFDVMAFMLQLKQSVGANAFTVIPNTVQTCIGPFGKAPMVMTLAERPFVIVQVNEHWEDMTGWKAEDVVGKESCKILQGEKTEKVAIDDLMSGIRFQRPAFSILTNYSRDKKKLFRNFLSLYPLSTDSKITHFLGLTVHVEWLENCDKKTSQHLSSQNKTERNENKRTSLNGSVIGSSLVQPASLDK